MPPPMRCTATSKRSGQQCRRFVMVGKRVCWHHGATAGRNGKEAALAESDVAATIAAYMQDDPRPIAEILTDAMAVHDAVLRATKARVMAGENVTADDVDRMIESARGAHVVALSMSKLGLEEQRVRIAERESAALTRIFDAVRDAAELSLMPAQRRVWDVVVGRVMQAAITDGVEP